MRAGDTVQQQQQQLIAVFVCDLMRVRACVCVCVVCGHCVCGDTFAARLSKMLVLSPLITFTLAARHAICPITIADTINVESEQHQQQQ